MGDMADDARAVEEREEFDLEGRLMNLRGKEYLKVADRVLWFRKEHVDGSIEVDLLEHELGPGFALFKATVTFHVAKPFPTNVVVHGHGSEERKDFPDYVEKAETKAIGRALAAAGYGTLAAMDEGGSVADTPQVRRNQPARRDSRPVGATRPVKEQRDPSPDEIATTGQIEGNTSNSVPLIVERMNPMIADLGWTAENGKFLEYAKMVVPTFEWKTATVAEMIQINDGVRKLHTAWEAEQIDRYKAEQEAAAASA